MRQAFWKGIEVETIPLKADGKRTQTGPTGGSEPQRATGPRGLGDPASRQAAGKSAWHGGWGVSPSGSLSLPLA